MARRGHAVTAPAKAVPYFSTTVSTDVDVDIDPDELHDAGWHHENECKYQSFVTAEKQVYRDAIASLHRQAHPSQPLDPFVPLLCREEPCRSLGLAAQAGNATT